MSAELEGKQTEKFYSTNKSMFLKNKLNKIETLKTLVSDLLVDKSTKFSTFYLRCSLFFS